MPILSAFPASCPLLELGVFFVVINCFCLSFMQIHAHFYINYIIYNGLLIFCCQNVAAALVFSSQKHFNSYYNNASIFILSLSFFILFLLFSCKTIHFESSPNKSFIPKYEINKSIKSFV